MTHSAAMAAEILQGKTILEALNTDLVVMLSIQLREIILTDRISPELKCFLR